MWCKGFFSMLELAPLQLVLSVLAWRYHLSRPHMHLECPERQNPLNKLF